MSWENTDLWDLDHIIPLAAAKNKKELLALGHYINIQPMWSSENYAKGDKYNEEEALEFFEWYYKKYDV